MKFFYLRRQRTQTERTKAGYIGSHAVLAWRRAGYGIVNKVIRDKMDTVSAHVVPLTFPS